MVPKKFCVDKVVKEIEDTITLELSPMTGSNPFPFSPGQFNMLYCFGVGEVPISISGDPAEPEILKHTIRMAGAVTKALFQLKSKSFLGVRGPFGNPWPLDQAKGNDVVIMAGGIGLAPLRPLIYSILAQRESFGRVYLLYGSKNHQEILYQKELKKWRARFDMDVEISVDTAKGMWKGNVGVVTTLLSGIKLDPKKTVSMLCGPEIMMRFATRELQQKGLERSSIFISMERNMKCGIGLCGHCQYGPFFVCQDGPVINLEKAARIFGKREI